MSLHPEDAERVNKWHAADPWKEAKHDTPGAFPVSPGLSASENFAEEFSIASAVRARRHEYVRKRTIKVKVGTWNVASISGTEKDLAGWFIHGLGVKGLHQDLSGLTIDKGNDSGEEVESVAEQEDRRRKKKSTLPKHETAAVPSEDDIGLYILGLQEVVDIASVTEAMRPFYDPNPAKKWKHALKNSLMPGYVKVEEIQLLGLLLLVYAAPDVAAQITSVDHSSVGTGALGYMGNKGAVSVRVVLGGTARILMVNCHLAAGADQTALTRRIWDTNQILTRTKFTPAEMDGEALNGLHESIGDEDFAFWFGDLNYRLDDIPGEDVRRLLLLHTRNEYDTLNKSRMKIDSELGFISASPPDSSVDKGHVDDSDKGKPAKESTAEPRLDPDNDPASLQTTIRSLFAHDQLRAQQKARRAFYEGWREGDINFLPTYKYDVGSVGMFDSGEKKRSPSWCDRILYRTRRDKEDFERNVRLEDESRKKDAEMQARGLDADVAEQEILFDYNPETDAADDFDEYDEAEDGANDSQPAKVGEEHDDPLKLEAYISHQRVLSSDHKPLSAVFSLTYDAIVPELKAKVHQDVAREFDKAENEIRPSLTVVVESSPDEAADADNSTGANELSAVEFGAVRYGIPITRSLTVANTGPISASFMFVDRGIEGQGFAPSWSKIQVHHDVWSDQTGSGSGVSFKLAPGETAAIDFTILVGEGSLVCALNEGSSQLDDVLVLRVLDGRDHFIQIRGQWLPTCFFRTIDELARIPAGVRGLGSEASTARGKPRPSSIYHSAPTELFSLTEAIPKIAERVVAEWTMLCAGEQAPWDVNIGWPFIDHTNDLVDEHSQYLASIREQLDTKATIDDHFIPEVSAIQRTELFAKSLIDFTKSLRDGIIIPEIWQEVEQTLVAAEKSRPPAGNQELQEMITEALSSTPVHSVSFTFITFMLTRLVNELSASMSEVVYSPQSRRSRSSTEVSEAPSDISVSSADTARTKTSFLSALTRRPGSLVNTPTTPTTPTPVPKPGDRRKLLVSAYAEVFAPLVIRSENDTKVKGKEKKTLESRKRQVLEVFMDVGTF